MAPFLRRPSIRAPFRNGAGDLVAFRYEDASSAEPPIPLPPPRSALRVRSPRTTRHLSSSTSSSVSASVSVLVSASSSSSSSSSSASASASASASTALASSVTSPAILAPASISPVVILPPYPVEPPRSLHPALRASKRDSILGPTRNSSRSSRSSSSTTNTTTTATTTPTNKASARVSNDSHTIVVSPNSRLSRPPRSPEPTSSFPASHLLTSSTALTPTITTPATSIANVAPQGYAARPTTPTRSRSLIAPASPAPPAPSVSPTSSSSFARGLTKTFSMRSTGARRLRKRSLGSGGAGSDNDNTLPTSSSPGSAASLRMRTLSASHAAARERTMAATIGAGAATNQAPGNASLKPLSASSLTAESTTPAHSTSIISTPIPGDDFWGDFGTLSFSKRGSLMVGGRRAVNRPSAVPSLAPSAMEASAGATSTTSNTTEEQCVVNDMVVPLAAPTTATEPIVSSESPSPISPISPQSPQIPNLTIDPPSPSSSPPLPPSSQPPPQPTPPPPPPLSGPSSTEADLESHTTPGPQTPESAAAKRARQPRNANDERTRSSTATTPAESPKPSSLPSIRVMSVDVERESQKVRSLYESVNGLNWQDGAPIASLRERLEPTEEVPSEEEDNAVASSSPPNPPAHNTLLPRPPKGFASVASASSLSLPDSRPRRSHAAPAGGLEDWDDVDSSEVDRYGFITERRSNTRANTPEVQSVRHTPRRRNMLTKRPGSGYSSSSPIGGGGGGGGAMALAPSRKVSARSLNTHSSEFSTASRRSTRSSIRAAANLLPHNRDRRWMDEAGEMLTLQPGLTDIAEDTQSGKIADALKRKEWERSEKWKKMAKVVRKGNAQGQGSMEFEFDTKSTKVIERTWKGIPDCWRAAAWHSFLLTSARAFNDPDTDEHLVDAFQRLQDMASPDDVQIDLDVPRTINRHILFRKRYRGGQRLLFRVLHAISLYFPDTGYVQGMASLAATLLCYYDEERCFVMMVRMWRYRGLEQLYQPGFAGLMKVLRDLEEIWVVEKDVASKLTELCIDPTAYGTRWYLTLFNLSIPFAAQLRVWDVFMLLGDCAPESTIGGVSGSGSSSTGSSKKVPASPTAVDPLRGIDTLHATSAALIHALREVLLDSDFENAMKALTAWIPIKDEELLMKVTRAEYKQHHGAKRKEKAKDKDKGQ